MTRMTREEAAEILDGRNIVPMPVYLKALEAAARWLVESQSLARKAPAKYENAGLTPEEVKALVPPPNDPLTMEELRKMDGEPVWVCLPNGSHGGWMINYLGWCMNRFASTEMYGTYGKSWLAYRRRPEEEIT